jgi:hypothetical protein
VIHVRGRRTEASSAEFDPLLLIKFVKPSSISIYEPSARPTQGRMIAFYVTLRAIDFFVTEHSAHRFAEVECRRLKRALY